MAGVIKRGKHLHFRLMVKGTSYHMPVNRFALPRMSPDERHVVTSMSEAERVWLPRFYAAIVAGEDPTRPPAVQQGRPKTVAAFLDEYRAGYIDVQPLRSRASFYSLLRTLSEHLGARPVGDLEKPATVEAFMRAYQPGHALATLNRALSALRGAINWGIGRGMLTSSPFHRHGIRLNTRREVRRDRRLSENEEARLLAAADAMNCGTHRFAGAALKNLTIAALDTGCREGELLAMQNRHINWEQNQILIPNTNAKAGKPRKIPFKPHGRLAEVLRTRAELGPNAFTFGHHDGRRFAELPDSWNTLVLIAHGLSARRVKKSGRVDPELVQSVGLHFHDLRHEAGCRWLYDERLSLRTIQLLYGHADLTQTARYLNVSDAEVLGELQRAWREQDARAQSRRRDDGGAEPTHS